MEDPRIVFFDDEETWACLESCWVSTPTAEQLQELEEGSYPKHMTMQKERLVHLLPVVPSGGSLPDLDAEHNRLEAELGQFTQEVGNHGLFPDLADTLCGAELREVLEANSLKGPAPDDFVVETHVGFLREGDVPDDPLGELVVLGRNSWDRNVQPPTSTDVLDDLPHGFVEHLRDRSIQSASSTHMLDLLAAYQAGRKSVIGDLDDVLEKGTPH